MTAESSCLQDNQSSGDDNQRLFHHAFAQNVVNHKSLADNPSVCTLCTLATRGGTLLTEPANPPILFQIAQIDC